MKSAKRLTIAVAALTMAAPVAAQEAPRSFQGLSLLGEPMYTDDVNPTNVTDTQTLLWAVADAKAAAEREPTIDNIVWYGRMLGYQTLGREAVAVFTEGLKRYPNSAKLLRHRAHLVVHPVANDRDDLLFLGGQSGHVRSPSVGCLGP